MSIISQIVNKFPSDYAHNLEGRWAFAFDVATASSKKAAFMQRYKTDSSFRKQANSSYTYKNCYYFDFWFLWDEFREYLKPEFQQAEMLMIEKDKASVIKIEDVSSALEITNDVKEFQQLLLKKQASKINVWFELERKLGEMGVSI